MNVEHDASNMLDLLPHYFEKEPASVPRDELGNAKENETKCRYTLEHGAWPVSFSASEKHVLFWRYPCQHHKLFE